MAALPPPHLAQSKQREQHNGRPKRMCLLLSMSRAKRLDFYPDLLRRVTHLFGVVAVDENAVETSQVVQNLGRVGMQCDLDLCTARVDERRAEDAARKGQPPLGLEIRFDDR